MIVSFSFLCYFVSCSLSRASMASCASSMMAWAMTTFSVRKNFNVSCIRAEKLQRQLQGVVLRPASAPVSELADQHAAALWFRPWHEVERPVAHLLAMAAMVLVAIVGFIVLIHNCIVFCFILGTEGHRRWIDNVVSCCFDAACRVGKTTKLLLPCWNNLYCPAKTWL